MTDPLLRLPPRPSDLPAAPCETVVVVGLGAMGGSVAKASAARLPAVRVQGVDPSPANAAMAARDGVEIVGRLDECRLAGSAVVYAAPLDATVALVEAEAALWSRAALVTDVAGLKAPVLAAARRTGSGAFVGAHPMCGSESAGYGAARADLFEGATIWLCPVAEDAAPCGVGDAETDADASGAGVSKTGAVASDRGASGTNAVASDHGVAATDALARAEAFWRALGGRPRVVDPVWHDWTMSRASHLPQLVAWTLAGVLADEGVARADLGAGGRDMTRLAASPPQMWLPLLDVAAADDAEALERLEQALAGVRKALAAGDAAAVRKTIREAGRWVSEQS